MSTPSVTAALQIAIAMAAIAWTKKRWHEYAVVGVNIVGVVVGVLADMHIEPTPATDIDPTTSSKRRVMPAHSKTQDLHG